MESLIKYRLLLDQLTTNETRQFFQKMVESTDFQNLLITALSKHFSQLILNSKSFNNYQINNIVKLISDIIRSRKKDKNAINDQPIAIKFDELPAAIISVTSSFLALDDNLALQYVNRKVYIGCNSPNALQILSILSYDYCVDKYNFEKYSSIKEFSCDTESITKLSSKFWRNLKNIKIFKINSERKLDENCINCLQHINYANIRRFELKSANTSNKFEYQLLSHFKNLEYLDLYDVYVSNNDLSCFKLFDKLRGMYLSEYDLTHAPHHELMELYSHQIESLYLEDITFPKDDLIYKFPKLQELKIESDHENIIQFLKLTNSLKMISIEIFDDDVKNTVAAIFTSQSQLEYIEINGNLQEFDDFVVGIVKGLFKTQQRKRKMIKIKLILEKDDEIEIDDIIDIMAGISSIMDKLTNNATHFMIYCKVSSGVQILKLNKEGMKHLDYYGKTHLINYCIEPHSFQFSISNKENEMHGGYRAYGAYIF